MSVRLCVSVRERERERDVVSLDTTKITMQPPWKCASLKCRVVTPICPIYIYHGSTQIYKNLQTRLRAFSKDWLPLLNSA